jgi:hypothetical protein
LFTIIGILLNFIVPAIFVFVLSSLALSLKKVNSQITNNESSFWADRISQSLLLSLVLISLVGYNLPKLGINPRNAMTILGMAIIFLYLYSFRWIRNLNGKEFFSILMTALIAAFWNIVPGIFLLAKNGVMFGMTSIFNNDISGYAGMATEVLDNGFTNSNHYFDFNINQFASTYIYQTPNSLIQFFSTATHLQPWQVMMPVLTFTVAYFSISVNRLVRSIFPTLNHIYVSIVSFIIPVFPIFGYITTNYFLGQILASAITLQVISVNIVLWKKNKIDLRMGFEVTGLLILSVYAYPHLLVPIFLLAFGLNLGRLIVTKKSVKQLAIKMICSVLLAITASLPYLEACYELIKTQSKISAGWPLPFFNPVSLFIYPSFLDLEMSKWINLTLWAIFISICVYLIPKPTSPKEIFERKISFVLIVTTILVWVMAISIRGRELSEYSSWKLFTYLLPIVLCVLIPLILMNLKFVRNIAYLLLGLSISFPLSTWQPYFKNQLFTSSSFVNAVEDERLKELKHLNIDLGYYFESMNAALIIRGPQIYLPGPTYYNKSFNKDACTLVWNTNQSHGPVIPLNESYGLGLGENSICK